MKNLVWFVLGTGAGFVLAHMVNKDPRGHELLAEIDARIGEFTDRIGDAYRDQQNRLGDLVTEGTDAAAEAATLAD
ncbi:ATPase [Microbacterium sp. GXF7504]